MHRASLIALASLLAIIPMSAQSQEATVSESPYQYVLDLGAGVQYQPKYPGSPRPARCPDRRVRPLTARL